jgi:two-component system sensor histidine kinase RegB
MDAVVARDKPVIGGPRAADGADAGMEGVQRLRLRTLVRLRWLAVVGQTGAVLIVYFFLGFPLPFELCLGIIALSAWLNIFITFRWRSSIKLTDQPAALLLAYDILQLAALLYLTGGLENPFAFLFLVPVTVSASSLPFRWTLWLGALAFSCATLLAVKHLPLPWFEGQTLTFHPIYIIGMWTALISGVFFSAIYARRIAEEARQMSSALTATELILAREQRLSALDGLAAAAAHELGTPLATIALVAKELKREIKDNPHLTEDIDLLISQSARCREILSRLANRDAQSDEMFAQVTLSAMIEDIVEPLRGTGVDILVDAEPIEDGKSRELDEPVFQRNPAITYGLGNLVENAIDFASSKVEIEARWSASEVVVIVRDDGPGFAQEIFDRLGDPFVTTRQGYGVTEAPSKARAHGGMGLGFFIAKTLLERSGATVTLANRVAPDHGAIVKISWPRSGVVG